MKTSIKAVLQAALICALLTPAVAWALSEYSPIITEKMIKSYDLLEKGKSDAAQKIYEQVLKESPGHPLALNNLAAIMVKKGKYKQALTLLQQALPRAKNYRVAVNRVCEVKGICLAFRPLMQIYGSQMLAPLVKLNIKMVQGKLAGTKLGK